MRTITQAAIDDQGKLHWTYFVAANKAIYHLFIIVLFQI